MRKECKVKNCINQSRTLDMCQKHYMQFRRNGYVPERTSSTKNDIIVYKNFSKMILRNLKQDIIGEVIVDNNSVELIKKYKWHMSNNNYTVTHVGKKALLLHRLLMDVSPDSNLIVDHINHNKFDNRLINLRMVTYSQNLLNRPSHRICINKNGTYTPKISIKRKHFGFGTYKTLEEAIIARNIGEIKYLKEFAPQR